MGWSPSIPSPDEVPAQAEGQLQAKLRRLPSQALTQVPSSSVQAGLRAEHVIKSCSVFFPPPMLTSTFFFQVYEVSRILLPPRLPCYAPLSMTITPFPVGQHVQN